MMVGEDAALFHFGLDVLTLAKSLADPPLAPGRRFATTMIWVGLIMFRRFFTSWSAREEVLQGLMSHVSLTGGLVLFHCFGFAMA